MTQRANRGTDHWFSEQKPVSPAKDGIDPEWKVESLGKQTSNESGYPATAQQRESRALRGTVLH
jgi:hypothetical protein